MSDAYRITRITAYISGAGGGRLCVMDVPAEHFEGPGGSQVQLPNGMVLSVQAEPEPAPPTRWQRFRWWLADHLDDLAARIGAC